MATKRMFTKDIVRTDRFLDMSLSTQALYFHLCLDADAKGFVSPRSIMRLINATNNDLNVLITKNFVIPFESGVVVITDWRVHNYIDEKKEAKSQYTNEYQSLTLLPKGKYQLSEYSESTPRELSHSIDKIRLDKIKINKVNKEKNLCTEEDLKQIAREFSIALRDCKSIYDSIFDYEKSSGKKYKDYKATLRNWIRNDLKRGSIKKEVYIPDFTDNEFVVSKEDATANLEAIKDMRNKFIKK